MKNKWQKKKGNFNGPSRWFVSLEKEETVGNLLIHCSWALPLRHSSLSLMGVSWVQPSLGNDVVVASGRRMKNPQFLMFGRWFLLAMWWCTWKERNCHIVEDKALSHQNFNLYFLRLLDSWSIVGNGKTSGHNDFFVIAPLLYMGGTLLVWSNAYFDYSKKKVTKEREKTCCT